MDSWWPHDADNSLNLSLGEFLLVVECPTVGLTYTIRLGDARMQSQYPTLDEAKRAALDFARRKLTKALDMLDKVESEAA